MSKENEVPISEIYTLGQLHDIKSVENFYDYSDRKDRGAIQNVENKYPFVRDSTNYENPYGNENSGLQNLNRNFDKEDSNSE